MGKILPFITDSHGSDRAMFESVGSYAYANDANDFDSTFESTYNRMMDANIDILQGDDIVSLIKEQSVFDTFKETLLDGVKQYCEGKTWGEHGTVASLGDQIGRQLDNHRNMLIKESTTVGQLLPIKMIDFPLIVKDHLKNVIKDIMQSEVVKTPVIKKQIQHTWITDHNTGKRYEYPQCFYRDGEAKAIFDAGKGLKLESTPVTLPAYNYDIIGELVPSITATGREKISYNTRIVKVVTTDDFEATVDLRINMSDGSWLGGVLNDVTGKKADGTTNKINDCIMGHVDFVNNTTSISCAAGTIKSVVMEGYLSNDLNERYVGFDYTREEREWKIEDGTRADVPYSIEDLDDANALLDLDLYKMTYSNIAEYLVNMEDADGLNYMDSKFLEVKAMTADADPLEWDGFVKEQTFDMVANTATTALPSEYIENELKFLIDRFVIDIADTAKLEDVTFVIYGNPRYISLLGKNVNWVVKNGDSVGGIKSTYSYGIMNTGGVKIQVVSSDKINVSPTKKGLRIVPYPISQTKLTHKHYVFTKHIITGKEGMYRAADRPGGSYTNIMGVSRYTNVSLQAIQAHIDFINDSKFINI